ncbi:MAG: LPS export ABC transporter periplasmic protein LptC [Actinomycetota bacterium]
MAAVTPTFDAGPVPPPPRQKRRFRLRGGPLARYSRFVGVMKVALPISAAVLLALILAWPRLTQLDDKFQIGFARLSPRDVETLSMLNARYYGLDADNKPFSVTADVAVQEPGNQDLVHLQAPKADFVGSGGANVFIEANTGLYHQSTKMLDLEGSVSLFHDTGYELHTESAQVDLAHNSARGSVPVFGHGPQGQIQSQGFETRDRGQRIQFSGQAKLTLQAAGGKGAAKPAKGKAPR